MKIEQIIDRYPKPKSSKDFKNFNAARRLNAYCTGGAYCLSHGFSLRFPNSISLANRIYQTRHIRYETAEELANLIIKYNDKGDFKTAWAYLSKVLEYHKH